MMRTALFLILGISAGFAFATFMGRGPGTLPGLPDERLDAWQGSRSADEFSPLEERLDLLEAALDGEIALRQSLQAELVAIGQEHPGMFPARIELKVSVRDGVPRGRRYTLDVRLAPLPPKEQ